MSPRTVGIAKPLADLSENEWSAQLFSRSRSRPGVAATCGWQLAYHTFRSSKSPTGFPDWVIVRERVIFAELKTEAGQPSLSQREWLDGLARTGCECYLWRPSDIDEIGRVLGKRWSHGHTDGGMNVTFLFAPGEQLEPRSLWIPGVGRTDTTEQQTLLAKGAA